MTTDAPKLSREQLLCPQCNPRVCESKARVCVPCAVRASREALEAEARQRNAMHPELWEVLRVAFDGFDVERWDVGDSFGERVTVRVRDAGGVIFGGLTDSCDLRSIATEVAERVGFDARDVFVDACTAVLRWLARDESLTQDRPRAVARLGSRAAIEIARQASPELRHLLNYHASLRALVDVYERDGRVDSFDVSTCLRELARMDDVLPIGGSSTSVVAVAQALVSACGGRPYDLLRLVQFRAVRGIEWPPIR